MNIKFEKSGKSSNIAKVDFAELSPTKGIIEEV
jgi:hypothetical protein